MCMNIFFFAYMADTLFVYLVGNIFIGLCFLVPVPSNFIERFVINFKENDKCF